MDLKLLASEQYPMRASSTTYLNCRLRTLLYMLQSDAAGKAAQTGTLIHKGVEAWARGGSEDAGLSAMEQAQRRFRELEEEAGDLEQAQKWLRLYIEDPRNAPLGVEPEDGSIGKLVAVEKPGILRLDPAPFDPTGEPLVFTGTCDQIREWQGHRYIWDLKTSDMNKVGGPNGVVDYYMLQQVLYAYMNQARVGGLILLRSYTARKEGSKGVFFQPSMHEDSIRHVLDGVRESIALLRMGQISPNPGLHCGQCYLANGIGECSQKLSYLENSSV